MADSKTPTRLFGRRLKAIREEQGLTQNALAAKMKAYEGHFSNGSVKKYEETDALPNVRRVVSFAAVLGVPVEDLTGGIPEQDLAKYFPRNRDWLQEALKAGDWRDKTAFEIGLELGTTSTHVTAAIYDLRRNKGIDIPHKRGAPPRIVNGLPSVKKGTIAYKLVHNDWGKYTVPGIAHAIGKPESSVRSSMTRLKQVYGYEIKHRVQVAGEDESGDGRVYVCGKCKKCDYYHSAGEYSCCLFNSLHFTPNREKHGPIKAREGGCDKFTPLRRGRRPPEEAVNF